MIRAWSFRWRLTDVVFSFKLVGLERSERRAFLNVCTLRLRRESNPKNITTKIMCHLFWTSSSSPLSRPRSISVLPSGTVNFSLLLHFSSFYDLLCFWPSCFSVYCNLFSMFFFHANPMGLNCSVFRVFFWFRFRLSLFFFFYYYYCFIFPNASTDCSFLTCRWFSGFFCPAWGILGRMV